MQRFKELEPKLIYIWSLVLVVWASFLLYALLPGKWGIWIYTNSDTLYLASIFRDLFIDKSGISGWHLNAAPNFFPEMLIYFPIMALLKGTAASNMAFGLVNMTLVLILLNLFLRTLDPGLSLSRLSLFNLLFLCYPLSSVLGEGQIIPSQFLLPGYHAGQLINTLLAGICFFRYLRNRQLRDLLGMALVTALATLSDKLFIMAFVAPVSGYSLLHIVLRKDARMQLKVLASTLLSAACGLLLFRTISNLEEITFISTSWKMFNFVRIDEAFLALLRHFRSVLIEFPLQGFLIMLALLFIPAAAFHLLYYGKAFSTGRMSPFETRSYRLLLFLLIQVVGVLFTPVINGTYMGAAHIRYNYVALLMGDMGLLYLILTKIPGTRTLKRYTPPLLGAFVLILSIILIGKGRDRSEERFADFVPESSLVLDSLQQTAGIRYGLAGYWEAKYSTMYSRKGVRVYSVHDGGLGPYYHVCNENWFHDGGKGRHADPVFNFVMTGSFKKTDKLKELFGDRCDTLYKRKDICIVKVPEFKIRRESRELYLLSDE